MIPPQPSGGFRWTQEPWGAALACAPLAAVAPHLFTAGNLRLLDDEREWQAVADRMGVERRRILLIRQVHGTGVATARAGATSEWPRPEADVIVSDDPAAAIGVRVADCAPVMIADRRLGVVAGAHAGWRGTVKGAAAVAVRALEETFGSIPEDLVAAVGPCLGPCCGEVGPEVVGAFREAGHPESAIARWFVAGASGRPHLDLWQANRDQLEGAGIPRGQVHVAAICTKSHATLFHSYRVDGSNTGRMLGLIRAVR